jgi:hypothetical protein
MLGLTAAPLSNSQGWEFAILQGLCSGLPLSFRFEHVFISGVFSLIDPLGFFERMEMDLNLD